MSALPDKDLLSLQEVLRRCSPETLAAAVQFREDGDAAAVPAIVFGVIQRYQPSAATVPLAAAGETARLVEDLGLDSLTMLEIVLTLEEVLGVQVPNEDLKDIRTLGQISQLLQRKLTDTGSTAVSTTRRFHREDLVLLLPQQPPFLFLDSAEVDGNVVRAHYHVTGGEQFFEGHFPGEPILPASIALEAIGQAATTWVLVSVPALLGHPLPDNRVLFATMDDARFYRPVRPGDVIDMELTLLHVHVPLAHFKGTISCGGERVASIERLGLIFGGTAVIAVPSATPVNVAE